MTKRLSSKQASFKRDREPFLDLGKLHDLLSICFSQSEDSGQAEEPS